MKQIIKLFFFLFLSLLCYGQEIRIIDSIDDKPIPYGKIYLENRLLISDSLGKYFFDERPVGFIIRANGYEDKSIVSLNSNIIKLKPIFNNIERVELDENNFNVSDLLGYKKGKNTIIIDSSKEFAIKIINPFHLCQLEDVKIPFKKSLHKKGYLILDIYEEKNNKIGDKLNSNNYVISLDNLKSGNSVKINEKIIIEESFYVSVIWVENLYTKSNMFTNKVYLNVKDKSSSGKMFVRKSTYNSWDIKPFEEDSSSKNSIIPAFSVSVKCKKE